MKKAIIIFLVLLMSIFTNAILSAQGNLLKSNEVKDFSNVKLPSYTLPAGSLSKGEAIKECISASKQFLKHGQVPKAPQCILIPYGTYAKIFSPGFGLVNLQKNKLLYLITIDVNRTVSERRSIAPFVARMSEKEKEHFTTHQDFYLVDPKTGKIIAFGGNVVKWVLPEQK